MRLGCTQRLLTTALLSFLAANCVLGDEKPCIIYDNGKLYDLNPLKSKTDYQIVTRTGRKLFFNVCQAVKTETFGLTDNLDPSEIGGFIRLDHGDFSIGKYNTSLSIFDSKPRFFMSEGSRCKSRPGSPLGDFRASSAVEFTCDTSVSGVGSPQLSLSLPPGDEENGCAFMIEWRTPYACPMYTSGFWKFITSMIIIVLVVLMTYTVLGTLYNRFVLDLRGFDQIPQFSTESMKYHLREAFEWTKDMAGILFLNFSAHNVPSSNHPRTPNPVSHQAQVSGMMTGMQSDIEQGGGGGGGGGFIRPHPTGQPPLTNPVSHHTQSVVVPSLSQSSQVSQSTSPNTPLATPVARKFESTKSTEEEREFLLIDGEDNDNEDGVQPAVVLQTDTSPADASSGTKL